MAKYFILMLAIMCPTLASCSKTTNDSAQTSAAGQRKIMKEVSELSKLISLPSQPISVRWLEPNPNNKENTELLALLQFSETDYAEIVENSAVFDLIQDDKMPESMFNEWVPETVAKSIKIKKENGIVVLVGVSALKPNLFTKTEASPFIHGNITPLSSGYIFLYLYIM